MSSQLKRNETKQNKTKQNEPNRTEPNRAEPNRTEPKQNKTKQNETKQNETKQNKRSLHYSLGIPEINHMHPVDILCMATSPSSPFYTPKYNTSWLID